MYRRLVPILHLLFVFFSLAAATIYGQAVVPNPADIAPVINPPNPQTNIVISMGDFMTGGVTPYAALKQALNACLQQHAAKLVIPTGTYVFDDPKAMSDGRHVGLFSQSDLIIDGQGSQFIFHFPIAGFAMNGDHRIIIRNLIIDSDLPLASLGIAQKVGGNTNIRILDAYPVNSSTPIYAISPYDIQNLKWRAAPGEIFNPSNVTMPGPQTFTSPGFNSLTDGEEVVVRHYSYEGHAFSLANDTSDFSFENITIYGAPGMGFYSAGLRGFRLSHCRIMQRPGTNRPVSTTADGSHFTNTTGDILIEDCEFSGMGDDSVNILALWLPVTQKLDLRTIVLTRQVFGLVGQGSELKLVKRADLSELARLNVTQVTYDGSSGNYTVTVDRDLPGSLAIGDLAIDVTKSNPRFLIRRNYFHDHRARAMLIQSLNGVVENNKVRNTTWQSMDIFTDAAIFNEGPGAEKVIVRNNTFEGCSYGNYGSAAQTMACITITGAVPSGVTSYPVIKNILFEGNIITDTPGLAIFISSASGITISNNVIINSNTLGAFPPFYGSAIGVVPHGSLMVTKSSNVLVTGNLQLVRNPQTEKGTFVDSQTTSGVTTQNNPEDLVTPNMIDSPRFFVRQHYIDFLSRYPDESGWTFWTGQITECGTNAGCLEVRRINVSAAYFLSIEFQETGYLVYRFYNGALNRANGLPRFQEFLQDTQEIGRGVVVGQAGWEQQIETNKVAFCDTFVTRSEFLALYPASLTSAQYVDALYAHAGITPSTTDRQAAIDEFNNPAGARGRVLRRVAENQTLNQREFNRAFVLMQYFGYLRRNPDDAPDNSLDGYNFWLTKLNNFGGNFINAEMVKAFLNSSEYRQRFGP